MRYVRTIVSDSPEFPKFDIPSLLSPDGYRLADHERFHRACDMPDRSVFYVHCTSVVANGEGVILLDKEASVFAEADVREEILFEDDENAAFSRVLKVEGRYVIDESFENFETHEEVKDRFYLPDYLEEPTLHDAIANSDRFVPVLGWAGNECQLEKVLDDLAGEYNWRIHTPNVLYLIHVERDEDDDTDENDDGFDDPDEPDDSGPDGDFAPLGSEDDADDVTD